jgi:hypothetical protein
VTNRDLTRLFLRRFLENDLVSSDADRLQVVSQTCGAIITGALFVTIPLSFSYLASPFPMPGRTAVNVIRVQFLYTAWTMTVMAIVAVSVWDALALDSRDTQILGPLPLRRGAIVRAKISALLVFAAAFAASLNLVPAVMHPVFAVARLRPSLLHVVTLVAAHLASTTAAAAFGFGVVLGLREVARAILGSTVFRRVSVVLQAALVVTLVTMLLLVPGFSFRVTDQWLATGTTEANLLPPMWFAGLHDMLSGHVWAQLPRPILPARVDVAERAFEELYQDRRFRLHQLGVVGGSAFLAVLAVSTLAYLWNTRRLPDPPSPRIRERSRLSTFLDASAESLLARRPLVRAGFSFAVRVLARSVQNRLSVGVPLAVALAVATVSLRVAGMDASLDFSSAPVALLAVQTLFVCALIAGFRHSIRVPPDLRARWIFHLVRPADQHACLTGAKRAALVRLVLPALVALLPLNVLAFGWHTAVVHFAYGLLLALVMVEVLLLAYPRLPFASSYVPAMKITTHGPIYALVSLIGVYTLAWIERVALASGEGIFMLFGVTGAILAVVRGIDAWQRRNRVEAALDEPVDLPTLRLGLTD